MIICLKRKHAVWNTTILLGGLLPCIVDEVASIQSAVIQMSTVAGVEKWVLPCCCWLVKTSVCIIVDQNRNIFLTKEAPKRAPSELPRFFNSSGA